MNSKPFAGWFTVPSLLALSLTVVWSGGAQPVLPESTVVSRGPHSRVWQRDEFVQLNDGRTVNRPRRVVEYQTGLHFWDEQTQTWAESSEELEIVADGARAVRGQARLHVAGDANTFGGIRITMPDGQVLRVHLLGLAYTSADTFESVWLARLQNSQGWLLSPSEVLFPEALAGEGGVTASVRYRYGRWGVEQDVLVGPNSKLPPPSTLGFKGDGDDVLVEVWSEIVAGPEPTKSTRFFGGLADETLDFASAMRMTRGSAFALDAPLNRRSGAPVFKTYLKAGNPERRYIIESVPFRSIRQELDRLGALQAAAPRRDVEKISRLALLEKSRAPEAAAETPVRMAFNPRAFDTKNALAIDWVLYNAGDYTNTVVFPADSTALISGLCNFFGPVVFEGSACIKYVTTNNAIIQCYSNVTFKSDHYRPVIFTSRQDRSVGDDLYLAGAPTNYFQALAVTEPDQIFQHLRISYADYGLHTPSMKLRHAQFVHCGAALYSEYTWAAGTGAEVDNVLFHDVLTAFHGGYYEIAARHVTVHRCGVLADEWVYDPEYPSSLTLTNSLLSSITNTTSTDIMISSNTTTLYTNYVFNSRGSGIHYLPSGSPHRGSANTNIPAWLARDLRARTTTAPNVVSNVTLATNIALVPQVPRGGPIPDVGFSYAPLDVIYGNNVLTNATLSLYAGAVLGTFTAASNTHGLALGPGAKVTAVGDPLNPVRIVRYNTVQEQANTNLMSIYPGAQLKLAATNAAVPPSASFRFTEWSVPGFEPHHLDERSSNTLASLTFRDCEFTGGMLDSTAAQLAFTNCLFNRVDSWPIEATTITNCWYNNTFYGGSLVFNNTHGGPWEAFNNLFYNTSNLWTDAGGLVQGWNAYLPGAPIINYTDTNNSIITNIVFQTGLCGDFYLTNGSPLIDRGTNYATNFGLFWYATTVDQRPETNTLTDIGFHRVALDSTNVTAQPLDTDTGGPDGVANYIEDADGDGVQDAGETSVTRQDSPFLPRDYEPLGPSSRRTPLIISEIMYNPVGSQNFEFIELYNTHHLTQDLTGFQLRVDGEIILTFPTNLLLDPGTFLILSRDPGSLQATNVIGPYLVELPNNSGRIEILNARGAVLLDVDYSDSDPWPVQADGAGHSLVLSRPSYGEDEPRAWTASERVGGSPGYRETNVVNRLRAICINEFLADPASGQGDFIELHNCCNEPINVFGCYLSDSKGYLQKFTNTAFHVIPPRGFIWFTNTQLTFGLAATGNVEIVLASPDSARVLDAIHFEGQSNGVSMGRSPDGAKGLVALAAPTPGRTNSGALPNDVIISEVMFNPISGNDDFEFIELHNRGPSPVTVTNWRVNGLGGFIIPASTPAIQPDGFVVIARSNAVLRSVYPNLTDDNTVSLDYYPSRLSNRGQKLTLMRPRHNTTNRVVMHEFTYQDGGRWGQWADGTGSSLEIMDSRSDNRLAPNWSDSDDTGKSAWFTNEFTGYLDHGTGTVYAVEISLGGEGECLIDDVQVLQGGVNYVQNPTFDSGTNGWAFYGNQDLSYWTNSGGWGNSGAVVLRASGRGDAIANRVAGNLTSNLPTSNTNATLRVRARWLRGHPRLQMRLHGNYLEAVSVMPVPSNLGSPATNNTTAVANRGPAITDVRHFPILPAASEYTTVSARLNDPDGVTNVVLKYRIDPSTNTATLTMRDDGTLGDARADDGIFTAPLAGQAAGTVVAFRIEATDGLGAQTRFPTARVKYPGDTEQRECLIRWGEAPYTGSFGAYRIWITQATMNRWAARHQSHNGPLDVTFVYGSERVIYNAEAYYSGSPSTSIKYDGPTNKICGYTLQMPKDDPVLGVTDLVLDFPLWDNAAQREQVAHWIAQQLSLSFNYRRFVQMFVNGMAPSNRPVIQTSYTAKIFEDTQQPGGDYLAQWYADGDSGELRKLDLWEEFKVDGTLSNREPTGPFPVIEVPTLRNFWTTNFNSQQQERKLARYRWNWERRAEQFPQDTFTNLFDLIERANKTDNTWTTNLEAAADIEQWMRVFALEDMIGNWDSYGNSPSSTDANGGKNMYTYLPPADRWQLLPWDLDIGLNSGASLGTSAPLFDVANEPVIQRFYTNAAFLRAYWRAIHEAVNGPMLATNYAPILDGNYVALSNNTVVATSGNSPVANPSGISTWISGRRSYLTNQLGTKGLVAFSITNGLSHSNATITLGGGAPIQIRFIRVVERPTNELVEWPSVTNWTFPYSLTIGTNPVSLQGYDWRTNALLWATTSVSITRTNAN